MEAELLLRSLKDVRSLIDVDVVILVDHEGYRHTEKHWWIFDARYSSPKTCPLCQSLNTQMFRGDVVPYVFPYHTHQAVNAIRAMVHPHCRCRLRWAGRTEKTYNTPLGILLPEEARNVRFPSNKLLEQLYPSQLQQLIEILRSPWEL